MCVWMWERVKKKSLQPDNQLWFYLPFSLTPPTCWPPLGVGMENWSQAADLLESSASEVTESVHGCCHVVLTAVHCENSCIMTSNSTSTLLETWKKNRSVMVERKTWSNVWFHFTKKDYNSDAHNVCKMIISTQDGNHQQSAETMH